MTLQKGLIKLERTDVMCPACRAQGIITSEGQGACKFSCGSKICNLGLTLHMPCIDIAANTIRKMVIFPQKAQFLKWGDDEHNTVLCPNCENDLMGGFPLAEEYMHMHQCPYCGIHIDDHMPIDEEDL